MDLPLIGISHVCGGKGFFPFIGFVKACVDECGAFAEFLIDRYRHCTLADEPLLTAVSKSERSLALGEKPEWVLPTDMRPITGTSPFLSVRFA